MKKPLSKHETKMKEEREALFSLLERSTATRRREAVGGAPTWWPAVAPPRRSNFSSFFEFFLWNPTPFLLLFSNPNPVFTKNQT